MKIPNPLSMVLRGIAGAFLLCLLPFIGITLAGWVIYAGLQDYKLRRKMTEDEKQRGCRMV